MDILRSVVVANVERGKLGPRKCSFRPRSERKINSLRVILCPMCDRIQTIRAYGDWLDAIIADDGLHTFEISSSFKSPYFYRIRYRTLHNSFHIAPLMAMWLIQLNNNTGSVPHAAYFSLNRITFNTALFTYLVINVQICLNKVVFHESEDIFDLRSVPLVDPCILDFYSSASKS